MRMPSFLRSFAFIALSSATAAFAGHSDYCLDYPLSCTNTTAVKDTCCFNSPGGELLQTQFWDYNPARGPAKSWTIHGLWPDNCDGTYQSYCDPSRQYTNITQILQSYSATHLLSYMNKYWKNADGTDESFWEHEWGKHGTCVSTFDTKCYVDYTPQEEVVDYFRKTVELFRGLDTYKFLAMGGVVPSKTRTYSALEVQRALGVRRGGVNATIGCGGAGKDELQQVYYHFHVAGSAQDGVYVPTEPDGKSFCPQEGIKYLPKNITTAA